MPACLGGTVRCGSPSPLGIAAKPLLMGTGSSCLPPGLFAKTTVNPRVPKQAQPRGEARGFCVTSERSESVREHKSPLQLLPNSFWKEEIRVAALPAEGQGEASLRRESLEELPVLPGTQPHTEWEHPERFRDLLGQGAWVCPLDRAEEDGAGARIPKPTCSKCFVIEFHKKIKSITESNKALKVFN